MEKETGRGGLRRLVEAFESHERDHLAPTFNETQARTDFISPMLEALGWDIYNRKSLPQSLREVVEEANVSIADDAPSRRPDYELRKAGTRKLFVEAKKPSVNLAVDGKPAFQARRYGYSAGMPIVVLTNFRQLAIYDCTGSTPPHPDDGPEVARLHLYDYKEFESNFDEIWEYFSREVIYSGRFDEKYSQAIEYRGATPFDALFLSQVRRWREALAVDIHTHAPGLSGRQLTYAVQIFLSRLIFLRICEDREIEKYEQLREVAEAGGFDPYRALLQRADDFYDSGLFDVLVDARLGTIVSDGVLISIIQDLYFPQSPYTFAVVEAEVLGEIYEQFLGEEIAIENGAVEVILRPEVRESGGVVPTPRNIVDEIVDRTLKPILANKSPSEIEAMTVLDMCCGSGIFLLSAFDRLCDHYLEWYVSDGVEKHQGRRILEQASNTWRLTFAERREILLRHIRGVDIDADAVEVAQLSLQLKLIEGQSHDDLGAFVKNAQEPALPNLGGILRSGNSLVARAEWESVVGAIGPEDEETIQPFDWGTEFPKELGNEGFDVIVGNPPYIRIQNMAKYAPGEVNYYQSADSPYSVGLQDNFDKYALFIERGLELLSPTGRLGFIVPHKFMSITSGRAVRALLHDRVDEILHFGSQTVFPGTSNYTALVIVGPSSASPVHVEMVSSFHDWSLGLRQDSTEIERASLSDDPWRFASETFQALIARLRAEGARPLTAVADIFVGLQTSADSIYIVTSVGESALTVTVNTAGRSWELEKEIIRPCLLDVQIDAFAQPVANTWMIFPYEIVAGVARLIQPAQMESDYPGCWEYLQAHRERLEKRNVTGGRVAEQQWYQFGRSQSLVKLSGRKIIWPALSKEPRYTLDSNDLCLTGGGNGPYYLLRSKDAAIADEVLLAVLNHPLAESIIRGHTSVFRGGYYSHGKQFVGDVMIPPLTAGAADEISAATSDVMEARRKLDEAVTPSEKARSLRRFESLRGGLDALVDKAFGLTDLDREAIESIPIP